MKNRLRHFHITIKNNFLTILLSLLIFITVFSQNHFFIGSTIIKFILYGFWIFTFLFLFVLNFKKIYFFHFLDFIYFIPFICFIFIGHFFNIDYLNNQLIFNIVLSLFVFITGYLAGLTFEREQFRKLCIVFVFSTIIPVILIFSNFIIGSDLDSREYAYAAKNSISIISAFAIAIMIFIRPKNKKMFYLEVFYIIFLIATIILLKCRTVVFSLIGLGTIYFISKNISFKEKKIVGICLGVLVAIILIIPQLRELIIDGLLLAGRDGTDLDDLSSGRLSLYNLALYYFSLSPIVGIGDYYVDSLFILSLTSFGSIGFILIIPIISFPYLTLHGLKKEMNNNYIIAFSFAVILFINSLLEAYTPFGPGTVAFMFWITLGLFFSKDKGGLRDKITLTLTGEFMELTI